MLFGKDLIFSENSSIKQSILIIIGVPKFLRSDYGTENCIVAALHIAFHLQNSDTPHSLKEKAYIYMVLQKEMQ